MEGHYVTLKPHSHTLVSPICLPQSFYLTFYTSITPKCVKLFLRGNLKRLVYTYSSTLHVNPKKVYNYVYVVEKLFYKTT